MRHQSRATDGCELAAKPAPRQDGRMQAFLLEIGTPFAWNATGIVCGVVGVLLLFRFGMPFRLSTSGGGDYITTISSSEPSWVQPTYTALGYLGLFLVVFGGACQLAGAYVS